MPEELWMEVHDIVQETGIKTIPKKKKCKKAKWLSEESLQIDEKRREVKGIHPWVGNISWRRAWQPIPVFLPGESPWTEEPGGLQSMVSQRVGHD